VYELYWGIRERRAAKKKAAAAPEEPQL